MSKLGEAKTLGGIGSILQLIPFVNIVGYILVLIACKNISEELGDRSIFDNMLYAVITGIVGVVVGLGLFFAGILTFSIAAVLGALAGLAAVWVFLIISSIFIKRAYDTIGSRLNVGAFGTAGMLYFIGSLLTIVFGLGLVIILVALIFQIIAFFSIPEGPQQPLQPMQPQPQPVQNLAQASVKFCPKCGTQMASSAVYCPKCGARQ